MCVVSKESFITCLFTCFNRTSFYLCPLQLSICSFMHLPQQSTIQPTCQRTLKFPLQSCVYIVCACVHMCIRCHVCIYIYVYILVLTIKAVILLLYILHFLRQVDRLEHLTSWKPGVEEGTGPVVLESIWSRRRERKIF